MSARRIDALYCTRETAGDTARKILADIENRCQAARQEVSIAINERIEALQERQKELIASIDRVGKQKAHALDMQLQTIEAGTCRPAPMEDPENDPEPDPNRYILCADAAIDFKIGEEDFLEKIPDLGSITEASTYASRSFARGPALGASKVGNPSLVWVYACDKDGARRTEGGDTVLAEVSAPEAFESVDVEDMKDGRYKVSFVPCQEGSYTLSIKIGRKSEEGEDVRGGPFSITVQPPTPLEQLGGEGSEQKPRIGETLDPTGSFGSLLHPSGMAFDHSGRFLFVADQGNHRLQVYDTSAEHLPVHVFGKKGLGTHELDSPCDIAVDNENNVVVTDLLNHRLQVYTFFPRTRELRFVRSVEHGFDFPKGVLVTDDGFVMVCDSGNHKVKVFNLKEDFSLVREFGTFGTAEGELNMPLSIALNRSDEILVSDASDHISVFDKEGNFLRCMGLKGRKDGCMKYPVSIAVSDEDHLYVCDQGNRRVQVLRASDGAYLHKWGGDGKKAPAEGEEEEQPPPPEDEEDADKPPAEDPGMQRPSAVAVSSSGLVVIADYDRHVLWTF